MAWNITYSPNVVAGGGGGDLSWQLASGHYVPAYVTPTVMHPRPDGETNSWARCRLAPSDIAWSIPIVIQGGAWPFECVITDGPVGMTIGEHHGDANYMVLSWASPTIGTHDIALRLRTQDYGRTGGSADATGEIVIEFTLVVVDKTDNTKFLFIDAASGSNGNSGAYGSPWQTLAALEAASTNGKQVFFRAGTYATTVLTSDPFLDFGSRARVLIGYPGENATVNMDGTSGRYFYLPGHDSFVQNLTLTGGNSSEGDYWHQRLYGHRQMMFDCVSSNLYNDGTNGGDSNHSAFFMSATGAGSGDKHNYICVVGNTFTGYSAITNGGSSIWYSVTYGVFENNSIEDMELGGSTEGFRTKGHCKNVTIRNNRNVEPTTFGETGAVLSHYQGIDGGAGAGDDPDGNEICWNYITGPNSRDFRVVNYGANSYESWTGYVYRNTFKGGCAWLSHSVPCTLHVRENVLLTATGTVNDSYTGGGETAAITIVNTNNVVRGYTNAATTIDGNGLLLDAYLSANGLTRGTRGHEVA